MVPRLRIVLTVDDLRLIRMEFQSLVLQPPAHPFQDRLGLGQTHAVDHRIIGIPLEREGEPTARHTDSLRSASVHSAFAGLGGVGPIAQALVGEKTSSKSNHEGSSLLYLGSLLAPVTGSKI